MKLYKMTGDIKWVSGSKNLRYAYGSKLVLRDISLLVNAGEYIGIVGSGCGKSTLLKLLAGLYQTQSGVVEVHGACRPEEIRKNVAMVMQNTVLFPASIKENITCGHPMSEEVIWQACKAAQLTRMDHIAGGRYRYFCGRTGRKGIRRAGSTHRHSTRDRQECAGHPAGEATSALDGDTGSAVLAALDSLTRGRTVVSVSHRHETLANCSRIYKLEDRRLHSL